MKNNYLLPNRFKTIGWILFIPSFIVGALILFTNINFEEPMISFPAVYSDGLSGNKTFFAFTKAPLIHNVIAIILIISGLLIGFSREKIEDEYIDSLRLKSVMWSILISYTILLVSYFTIFGMPFLYVMVAYMFLPLFLYIFRFHYLLYKNRNILTNEK